MFGLKVFCCVLFSPLMIEAGKLDKALISIRALEAGRQNFQTTEDPRITELGKIWST